MTKEQLLAKFDPANATNLSESDLEQMRNLTDDEIGELAKAYPNQASRKAYLVLFDKNIDAKKQLYPLSTWQNLHNVRKFANRKSLVPHTFRALFQLSTTSPKTSASQTRNNAPAKKVTVDLSAQDAANELKKAVEKRSVTTTPSARKDNTAAKTQQVPNKAEDKKTAPAKAEKATAPKKSAEKKGAAVADKTQPVKGAVKPADQEFSSGTD